MSKKRYMISSIFDSTGKFQLDESFTKEKDPRVDGENIIGSVEGVFFVPDGFSRNNRFYPCELWQKQLSDNDINRRLDNSIMFGCIGHTAGPVTEQDLSEGKVSHIMNKLWIDESTGMGMGKAYILNTPAGRNLKTYLKAGSNLKVSSRGEGSFAEGMEKDGHPVVEASSYSLITFDFVIEPGFTETNPQLQENYIEEVLITDNKVEDKQERKEDSMDAEKILEEYKTERDSARTALEESKQKHSEEVAKLNEELAKRQDEIKSLTEKLDANAKKADIKSSVSRAKIRKLESTVESFSDLGSAEDIKKASMISKAAIQELKSYKSLGKLSDVQESINRLVKVSEELKEYKSLGSIKSLKELMSMSERFATLQARQKVMDEAKKLSEESGKAIEEVAKMIKEKGLDEAKKALTESKETETKAKIDETLDVEKTEKKETQPKRRESLAESIFDDTCSRMFIHEDDEEEEQATEEDEDKKKLVGDKDAEKPEDEDNAEDGENADEEEKSDEERLDDVEDQLDSVQSQVDALTASFDKILGDDENADEDEDDEFDFEIE